MLVRPPSQFTFSKPSLKGSGRINSGTTHHPTNGATTDLAKIGLIGTAQIRGLGPINRTASGTTPLGKLSLTSGALARRRSKQQGIAPLPLRGVVIAGSVTAIDADAAVTQLYNSSGNPSGFGPSDDPEGVFYGRTDLISGDVWWPSTVPASCTVAPLPGGSFTLTVGGSVSPGSYSFTWTLRKAIGGVRTTGTKGFTVT